jgi:hypothetical protein
VWRSELPLPLSSAENGLPLVVLCQRLACPRIYGVLRIQRVSHVSIASPLVFQGSKLLILQWGDVVHFPFDFDFFQLIPRVSLRAAGHHHGIGRILRRETLGNHFSFHDLIQLRFLVLLMELLLFQEFLLVYISGSLRTDRVTFVIVWSGAWLPRFRFFGMGRRAQVCL